MIKKINDVPKKICMCEGDSVDLYNNSLGMEKGKMKTYEEFKEEFDLKISKDDDDEGRVNLNPAGDNSWYWYALNVDIETYEKKKNKTFPHLCPRCSKPAYIGGMNNVECSNKSCKNRKTQQEEE